MPPSSTATTAIGALQRAQEVVTAAPRCRATAERPVATDLDQYIAKPSVARANVAVSKDAPNGSPEYAQKYKDFTVLQQHVLFWDRDNDGLICAHDTLFGFMELGFNFFFALMAATIIHAVFSYPTCLVRSWLPDPWFRLHIDGIHKVKHGSDCSVFDTEGRFVPQKFEDIFAKFDLHDTGALTLGQMWALISANRVAADPFGWCAAVFEFGTTWLLLQRNGRVSKEDLRQVYDGSMFWRIRKERLAKGELSEKSLFYILWGMWDSMHRHLKAYRLA